MRALLKLTEDVTRMQLLWAFGQVIFKESQQVKSKIFQHVYFQRRSEDSNQNIDWFVRLVKWII